MSKWKCDICKKEFDNFHAQGFDNKIYCPLCFFKEENRRLKEVIEEVREYVNTKLRDVNLTYGIDNEFREEYDVLLQILDKAKENK